MKAFVNTSKVVLLSALLGAVFAGCDRNATDQTTGAAGTSAAPSPSSTVGSAGGTATTPSSATGMSGTAGSTSTTTTTGADTTGAAAGTTGSTAGDSSSATTAPAGADGAGSAAGSANSSGVSGTTSSTVGNVIDDSVITTKVKTALMADADIKGTDISVETNKGEVMLSGFVDSQAQIDKALKVANAVEGVKRVDNKMTIKQ